jgi:hypothetical protein
MGNDSHIPLYGRGISEQGNRHGKYLSSHGKSLPLSGKILPGHGKSLYGHSKVTIGTLKVTQYIYIPNVHMHCKWT